MQQTNQSDWLKLEVKLQTILYTTKKLHKQTPCMGGNGLMYLPNEHRSSGNKTSAENGQRLVGHLTFLQG